MVIVGGNGSVKGEKRVIRKREYKKPILNSSNFNLMITD